MKYSKEKEQFQKVYEGVLKRKYKSIKYIEINEEEFDETFETISWTHTFKVTIIWDVREAIREKESFGNLARIGADIFQVMFKKSGMPWVYLKSIEDIKKL